MPNGQNEHDSGQPEDSADKKFYLIVVPEHGKPECITFDAKEDLVDELRALSRKRVSCYVIEGERWHISLPPRKLIRPDGTVEADISYVEQTLRIDDNGFMFDDDDAVVDDDDDFEVD